MDTVKDIYHQFKNHLAVYKSLLRLKRSSLDNPGEEALLNEMDLRFAAISLVYQQVYQQEVQGALPDVLVEPYLKELFGEVAYPPHELNIELKTSLETSRISSQNCVTLGILSVELILFSCIGPDKGGVTFEFEKDGDELILSLDSAVDTSGEDWYMIEALTGQLGGVGNFQDNPIFKFPKILLS